MITTVATKAGIAGALTVIATVAKKLLNMQKNDSLVSFTKVLRVEPVTMIDERLKNYDNLPDILQTLLTLFCGYYLQAVACMTNVGQINVVRMLDTLNPNRDGGMAASSLVDAINGKASPSMLSMESFGTHLPDPVVSMESPQDVGRAVNSAMSGVRAAVAAHRPAMDKNMYGSLSTGGVDLSRGIKAASEAVNLAVGKLLEVPIIGENNQKATFPISVRLATMTVNPDVLTHILGTSGSDNSYRERIHRWRAGELSLVQDLILCRDMILADKRLMAKDTSGAMSEIARRRAANTASAFTTGTPSVGSASGLVVLSKDTAVQLERSRLGRLDDPQFRDAVFADSLNMIMVVVDQDRDLVTIYTRDIALPVKLSVREIKSGNSGKGGGFDINEIMKAYRLGNSAVF